MPDYWLSVPYVLTLSVLSEVIALLAIGLVRGWGEVVPRWIPFLGGLSLTALFSSVPLGDDLGARQSRISAGRCRS